MILIPRARCRATADAARRKVVNDYRFLELSLRAHPPRCCAPISPASIIRNEELRTRASGERVTVSGLVTIRQRPGSAAGVIFMTIEDETAIANIIVWPKKIRALPPDRAGRALCRDHRRCPAGIGVIHVVADRLADLRRCSPA